MYGSRPLILSVIVLVTALVAPAGAAEVIRMIRDVQDTAEQEFGGNHDPGLVRKGSSDLELGMEGTEGYTREMDTPQRIALLYRDLGIPAGATINDAWIQFMVDEPDKTTWFPDNDPEIGFLEPLDISVTIYGLLDPTLSDLPPSSICNQFMQCNNSTLYTLTDLTGGGCEGNCGLGDGPMGGFGSSIDDTLVTTPVPWEDISTWTTGPPDYEAINGTAGPEQRTPSLASIVQEIVDLPEWDPDTSTMTFFVDPATVGMDPDTGDDIISRGNRTAINFCTPSDSRCVGATDPQAPVLTILYDDNGGPDSDKNGDGLVNAPDLALARDAGPPFDMLRMVRRDFGQMAASGSSQTAVPEPASVGLLMGLAVVGIFTRLARKR